MIVKKHTYYDSNLQSGDNYGVCFAFPQIIFHHFGILRQVTENFKCLEIIINSGENLLKSGKLALFVKSAFINYSKI